MKNVNLEISTVYFCLYFQKKIQGALIRTGQKTFFLQKWTTDTLVIFRTGQNFFLGFSIFINF